MKQVTSKFNKLLFLGILTFQSQYAAAYCSSFTTWVKDKSADGSIVILSDESVWEIDLFDRIDSMLWLPIDDVLACDNILINTNNGDKVGATKLR